MTVPKKANNKYVFEDFSAKELYRFAMNMPSDVEAAEKEALILELAERMMDYKEGWV